MPSPQSGHPSKRRKLNSSQSQSVKYSDSTKTEIADSLHSSGKRKRKLPSFAARPGSKSTDSINPTNSNQTRVPRRNKRRTASFTKNNTKRARHSVHSPRSDDVLSSIERMDVDRDSCPWSEIAVTSLTTILEFVNIKFLYFSASRVCRNWHATICGEDSDFVMGYFRKSLSLDPARPLSLCQLQSFKVPQIKKELRERRLSIKGKKHLLVQRLHESITTDGLPVNIKNVQSVLNRKRLIMFQIKELFVDELFCQNCHRNWNDQRTARKSKGHKKASSKKEFVRKLTAIHFGLRVCVKCQNLKEYQDVDLKALKYYGLNRTDIEQCGVRWREGYGQPVTAIVPMNGEYINAHVATEIAKMKYGRDFKRKTFKELSLDGGRAQNVGFLERQVDRSRFDHDEILYTATLERDFQRH